MKVSLARREAGICGTSLIRELARAAKGVGAALLLTSALAAIGNRFHEPEERMRAWAF